MWGTRARHLRLETVDWCQAGLRQACCQSSPKTIPRKIGTTQKWCGQQGISACEQQDNNVTGARRKPKKKLTPLQENRLLKIVIVLIILAVIWLLLAPGTGLYSLMKQRRTTAELQKQTEMLLQTNEQLQAEIDRLKHDDAYLEQVAREKYGLLKKNERVFDFSKKSKEQ